MIYGWKQIHNVTSGILVLLILGLLGVYGVDAAESLPSGEVGRYQLVTAPTTRDDGVTVFRIDTKSGKTWIYDTVSADIATEEYMRSQGIDPQKAARDSEKWTKAGLIVSIPPYWKELPERPSGVEVRPNPAKK